MKKKKLWVGMIILIAALSFMQACSSKQIKDDKKITAPEDVYTCSMHPQVSAHHPGDCPICGMKLVKKNTKAVSLNNIELGALLKPSNEFVIASLQVTTMQQKQMSMSVRAYGTVEYDAKAARGLSSRVSGRIEKLYLRYRYQPVEVGQKIMDIYSPELVTAQQNLLFVLKNDAGNISFIQAAKEKLLLLGMSEAELNRIIQTNKPLYSVSIYSNYSGHVHDATMSNSLSANDMNNNENPTKELSLKEGMSVQKGQTLFMIMDHHKAWAALQVFADDQPLVQKGNALTIVPEADTAAVINGTVDFIEPFFRAGSKTITVRAYFHNMAMLPIGSHVTADIRTNNKQAFWLPQSAVLSLGLSSVVLMKKKGGFVAHTIVTGTRSMGDVQVLSGIGIKDTVAVNAQYLIDSESFIKTSSN